MGLPDKKTPVTYADYLTWDEGLPCEVLNGEIINMTPSPTPRHQDILGGIYTEFRAFLKGKACRAFIAPIDVCLFATDETKETEIMDWLQPDLLVVCDSNKIKEKRIVGVPDMVMEVLSPSTTKTDRVLKFNAYAKAGVKEYWIVDPYHEFIESFRLHNNSYERTGQYFRSDIIPLSLFKDFAIDLSTIFIDD
jgi:Uma2 family endonuclease